MKVRQLQPDEFRRMRGAGGPFGDQLRQSAALPDTAHTRIVVMEDDAGAIKAYIVVFDTLHMEPVWFDSDVRRHVKAGAELFHQAFAIMQRAGAQSCFGIILDADKATVAPLAEKLGFTPLPGQVYALRLAEPEDP